jgi:hypothetical protein
MSRSPEYPYTGMSFDHLLGMAIGAPMPEHDEDIDPVTDINEETNVVSTEEEVAAQTEQ